MVCLGHLLRLALRVMTFSIIYISANVNAREVNIRTSQSCVWAGGGWFLRSEFWIIVILDNVISIILAGGCLLACFLFYRQIRSKDILLYL